MDTSITFTTLDLAVQKYAVTGLHANRRRSWYRTAKFDLGLGGRRDDQIVEAWLLRGLRRAGGHPVGMVDFRVEDKPNYTYYPDFPPPYDYLRNWELDETIWSAIVRAVVLPEGISPEFLPKKIDPSLHVFRMIDPRSIPKLTASWVLDNDL